jgi:indole-3-glycerol phosphate synthase
MLAEIAHRVKERLQARPRARWEAEIHAQLAEAPPVRDFRAALTAANPGFILEFKRRSPANGDRPLRIDAAETARLYEREGAHCVSVLTEPDFFAGSPADLAAIREAVNLPLLRKDFIIDELQILDARARGADAVLLITALLSQEQLAAFIARCSGFDLSPLVEVHTEEELQRALEAGADIIGVNNRNLNTLEIDLATGERVLSLIPSGCLSIAESGIRTREDIHRLRQAGADAFLIGTSVMRAENRQQKIRELLGNDKS